MKTVKLLLVLVGCLLGYNIVDASALADLEQSCGPINIPYQITAIATKNAAGAGKVVLAGYYENAAGYKQLFVGRENTAGTALDTATFGTCYTPPASGAITLSGYTILGHDSDATISATANWIPTAVIIDAANKIVVVGTYQDTTNTAAPQQGFIVRLTSAGALDITFGSAAVPTQGYCLYGPSDLSLPAPTPPALVSPIDFNSVIEHINVGLTISRYVIVGSGNPQGIVVAIQDGGATDGQLDTTFNGTGVFAATGDTLGGAATDSVVFNSMQYYQDVAGNLNYYVAGSVKTSGVLLALNIVTGATTPPGTPTSPVALQTAGFGPAGTTAGTTLGYLSVPGNLLGGSAGSAVIFNQLIQSSVAPNDWYIIGQMGGSSAFLVSILLAGASINSSFNSSAATITTFGKTPGVMFINSSQLGQTGTVKFSSLIQKADTNYYLSGVAGSSSFIASILNAGTGFNNAFGQVANLGYIAKTYTQVGLLEAPNITQALWDVAGPFFYLLSSDTSASSPGVRSSVAKIVADGSALSTLTYTGTNPGNGVTNPFVWSLQYKRNTNIAGASTNINVTIVQTPVGQAIQLLAPTDNPLLPSSLQQISIPGTVFDMTDCLYDSAANQTIVVGAMYSNNAGNGETNAYIARFDSDLTPDTPFGGLGYGYKNFDAFAFGGHANDPALFFSVLPPDVNGNYTVCGSVNLTPYAGLIAQIVNAGTVVATSTATFIPETGFKTYPSENFSGSVNAVLTGILKNTNFYIIGMTNVAAAIAVPSLNSATVVNPGNGFIANVTNFTTGAIHAQFAITPGTFGLTVGVGVHTQLSSFIQTAVGNFVVVANLPGTTNGVTTTNRSGICAILPDLTALYTTFGTGSTGYTLFDSASFGVTPVNATSMVRFETVDLLTNNDLLLLGKAVPNTAAGTPIKQTLVAQMKPTGVFNTRLNGTGYLLGTTDTSKQGTMTNYSENVISNVGVDGGIFVFGSGVASGTTNLVEIALIKRYGL